MKTVKLKFSDPLPKLIIEGKKTNTWRINDDKNIEENDNLLLISKENQKEFGKAIVISINNTTFREITNNDKETIREQL